MCYSYNVKVIVMLCKLDENYKEKCANYWDTNLDNFKIEKIDDTINLSHDVKIRKFKILKIEKDLQIEDKEKVLFQIHFTCWPDHSIPDNSYNEIINIPFLTKILISNDFSVFFFFLIFFNKNFSFIFKN